MDGRKASVWPVMITPFTASGEIDYVAIEALVAWYEQRGVDGLFAVCQSSEMFYLSLRERVELARFVKRVAHVPVIASGHISYSPAEQADELRRIADTGVDAVILVTNRLAREGDPSGTWLRGLRTLLAGLPDEIPLGLYECPYPYKHLLSEEELLFCAGTGRFRFLKDTCCNVELLRRRIKLIEDSPMRLYNANSATLLDSLRGGGEGFSGVMANFHPELYTWLAANWQEQPVLAEQVQAVLTLCSQIENQLYPTNAKFHLQQSGLPMEIDCRSQNRHRWLPLHESEVRQMNRVAQEMWQKLLPVSMESMPLASVAQSAR